MKPGHCTGNFLRLRRQSKNDSQRQNLKNSIKFFEKVFSKPLKPEFLSLGILKYRLWCNLKANNMIMWQN